MKLLSQIALIVYMASIFAIFPASPVYSFSIGEEREVGEKLVYAIRSNFEVLDDPDLQQYLEMLGEEVLKVAGIQFFNYHFYVVENKEFNAFAAPSGLIFFHSGLIEQVDSENELVSVLAHEIGHIVKRHISSRIDKGKKISLATMGMILASLALGGGAGTEALLAGSLAVGQSASLHFSRQDEEEADLLAYDWMKKLGRNPEGQVKMLQTMRQIARYRSAMIPQYLLTHPNPEARLDYVQTLVATDRDEIEKFPEIDNFSFLRFKYRIMALTKDTITLRGHLASVISSSRTDKMEKVMAKYGVSQLDRLENNYESSLTLLQEVIDEIGERNILLTDKGIMEFESGNSDKAYATLSEAFSQDRSNMYAAFSLAKVCFQLGLLNKAQDLYSTVMYELPEFSQVYFELGRLSAAVDEAGMASYYLGKYYLIEGKLDIAKSNFQKALQSDLLPEELVLDTKQSLDLIERLKK
ncbi:MAG: M48 family metalloprotease [Desulfopila sp.]|jgi:predicted Zn-dependent protease|nr:M48 family metalloprotease [Desulfopila sp.]